MEPDTKDTRVDESTDERIATLEADLAHEREANTRLTRRAMIDDLLRDAAAIDVETARLMVERECDREGEPITPEQAVERIRRDKHFLFAQERKPTSASAPHVRESAEPRVHRAATEARATGSRMDLMRYLRLRRAPAA